MAFWEAPSLTALCTAFLIFGLETVVLRFVARSRNKVAILADDWLSLLSLVRMLFFRDEAGVKRIIGRFCLCLRQFILL